MWPTLALALLVAATLPACSDDDPDPGAPGGSGAAGSGTGGAAQGGHGPTDECSPEGATRCAGTEVEVCVAEGGALTWAEPAACAGEQTCKGAACADPTAEQLVQASSLEAYVREVAAHTGWHQALDVEGMVAEGRATLVGGDGSDAVFYRAMHVAHLALRQGHQSLYASQEACGGVDIHWQNESRFGVCGRPLDDTIVVTYAAPGNPLGLAAGDRIGGVDGVGGAEILPQAALRPVCGVVSPSMYGQRTQAAASFFGTVPAGAKLDVAAPDDSARVVEVPDGAGEYVSCQDPFARDIAFNAQATVRPDGIAVIRLPRFYPIDQTLPQNPTQAELEAFIAEFQAKIVAVFDEVKDAPALIWDVRGNYGGITRVGLAIAGGMAGAALTNISYCTQRIPESDPPAFYPDPYAVYDVTPGGPFSYPGKSAILVDGLDYSAADYFPLAVRKATPTLIVGTPTAGAYGGPGTLAALGSIPEMRFDHDVNRCLDALTDEPLEGTTVEPDIVVEYDPADLAAGVDTVMEAAAAALRN
ncbi:MAG: S41 family peptidase [Polyangiaceae bacterium]